MNTEKRLVHLIVEHFTKHPNKRLTASSLGSRDGRFLLEEEKACNYKALALIVVWVVA